jgi:predicted RNA binding protein YcfA (HicA-like mRNA interferase family)
LEKDDERKLNNMKTKIISKILLSLGFVFVLGSAITQVHGGEQMPVITIHPTGDVARGKTGSFVLNMTPPMIPGGGYVNFSVSGTAIPGVDYVPLVSPAYVGPSGYGVILIRTLPDPRGSYIHQTYSVVVTLAAGAGYTVGTPSSAQMMIKP